MLTTTDGRSRGFGFVTFETAPLSALLSGSVAVMGMYAAIQMEPLTRSERFGFVSGCGAVDHQTHAEVTYGSHAHGTVEEDENMSVGGEGLRVCLTFNTHIITGPFTSHTSGVQSCSLIHHSTGGGGAPGSSPYTETPHQPIPPGANMVRGSGQYLVPKAQRGFAGGA